MVYITKSFEGILNFGARKEIFENAKDLRKNETEAEKILWQKLRNRKCEGLKFRRQHPVKEFILDFYCHEYLLGIEVDGSIHKIEEVAEYDINRQAEIENLGITVLRITNEEILNDKAIVLAKIKSTIEELHILQTQNRK
jgi:very-short-patch-repair endonuclease